MFCLYVKWNRFSCDSPGDGWTIRACFVFRGPLPKRRPAKPEAERLGRSGGSGTHLSFSRVSPQRHPCEYSRLRRLIYPLLTFCERSVPTDTVVGNLYLDNLALVPATSQAH